MYCRLADPVGGKYFCVLAQSVENFEVFKEKQKKKKIHDVL
jgi:hypothetical protein